jgi:hypothetical protein
MTSSTEALEGPQTRTFDGALIYYLLLTITIFLFVVL